jgi:hypothetical protein
MSCWEDTYVKAAEDDVKEPLKRLVDGSGVEEEVNGQAQELAKIIATHLLDDSQPPLEKFPSIPIENSQQELEYLLALEFLESSGFKFAPTVLRYESQHPELQVDRREIGKRLHLCTYDRTPLLVQLIEEQLKSPDI